MKHWIKLRLRLVTFFKYRRHNQVYGGVFASVIYLHIISLNMGAFVYFSIYSAQLPLAMHLLQFSRYRIQDVLGKQGWYRTYNGTFPMCLLQIIDSGLPKIFSNDIFLSIVQSFALHPSLEICRVVHKQWTLNYTRCANSVDEMS